jgi:hypothetical protein
MSNQPEALRLADALESEFLQGRISNHNGRKAAAELRRLHDNNEVLMNALWKACGDDEEVVNATIESQGVLT